MPMRISIWIYCLTLLACGPMLNATRAEVRLSSMFSNHMVLQREMPVPVWGWADPGEQVVVVFGGQTKKTTADNEGRWQLKLDRLSLGQPQSLVVEGADSRLEIKDILVGDVWLCAGQSNMEWWVSETNNGDLEMLKEERPNIRLLTVGMAGQQTPLENFDGAWERCTPGTLRQFSAVGYFFGKRLQQTTGVPIGLVDISWGASTCETWAPREKLEGKELYKPLLARWKAEEDKADEVALRAEYEKVHQAWKKKMQAAVAEGKPIPHWQRPGHRLLQQQRPANLYNSVIVPIAPFAIRGAVWFQGESNVGRAEQYRDLFPLMVESWRMEWGQGNFPFYWVQLADFLDETVEPRESSWAELREAQTMALDRLPNSAQVVTIDVGEGNNIHPRDKQTVGDRLARIALAKEYGADIAFESPRLKDFEVDEDTITVTLSACRKLTTRDTKQVYGFAIAGADKKWVSADAKIVDGNQIAVSSPRVPEPVAVRYAWADNPVCNVYTAAGLPLTPFRTDDWPMTTAGKR